VERIRKVSARRGKRTARAVMVLGTAALLAAGVLRRDRLLEEYYLWKLGSTESEERDYLARIAESASRAAERA
jgi:hypothetical protein